MVTGVLGWAGGREVLLSPAEAWHAVHCGGDLGQGSWAMITLSDFDACDWGKSR